MSKLSELMALRYGRSVDAPINFHHRTGDSEGASGNMLDLYAQERSVEEVIFEDEDELAKARFLKGFSGYLRKVFSRTEREFLRRLMSGDEKLQDVGRGMGVDWFKYMQNIQRRAYKNIKPLLKLSEFSGWSRAEEFTTTIMRRLALLDEGAELADILPNVENRAKVREVLKAAKAANKAQKQLKIENDRRVGDRNRYKKKHKEILAKNKLYREQHREETRAYKKKYREEHREEIREKLKAYREQHREELRAKKKIYYEQNKELHYNRCKDYCAQHREKVLAIKQAYRERHREELRAKDKAYYERKKAERAAAKAAQV